MDDGTGVERYGIYVREVNPEMRRLGWDRGRYRNGDCYELRKMCVDEVYQRFGLERAVQVSGDSSATVQAFCSGPNSDSFEGWNCEGGGGVGGAVRPAALSESSHTVSGQMS